MTVLSLIIAVVATLSTINMIEEVLLVTSD